ncbi:efflux transporter, outer membrane factor (OMF) lipoprotein, NodT family [Halpernia humi]|uniref:Efflux transporter, outer membrane factor (OMF) lipoprotein, NodT family n=1 Tax=Halpernia humi TaxID=493375 RepID=A0A1H5T8U1_9FLAO|nr:TolC family protein [Halpernia humi]SEF59206.1 efflux transporter, outer membrane factor (OMF) lipoprotein, NodT family [Halpernia humi]
MKFSFNIKSLFVFALVALSLTSCISREKYVRSPEFKDNIFRTDLLPKDSSTIAQISWKDFFTDPILQKHIENALANNLDVRTAVQNILISQAYLKQSKAAYLPTLTVGPSYTFQTQSENSNFGQIIGNRQYNHISDLSTNMNWDIDVWGKLSAQKRAQLATYLGTVEAHKSIKSDLVANIAANYYQLLTLDEQKRIINQTIDLRIKNLETTKALKNAGTLTEVAVQQSEALVYNAKAMLVDLDTQIEILENATSLLLGVPSQKIERANSIMTKFPKDISIGYSSELLANRPDVAQAEFQFVSAFELKNAAKKSFYPNFSLSANGGFQSVDFDKFFSANSLFATIVGNLVQPILNKRQIRTQYEVSLANKQIAYLNFRKTFLNAGQEVSNALKRYKSQDDYIALKLKEEEAYRKSVDYSQQLVNYGLANYLEVINASVNLLNTKLSISNAQYTKMKANIDLYRALGGGWK